MGTDSGIKTVVCQPPDFIDLKLGLFKIDERRGTDPRYNFRVTGENDPLVYAPAGLPLSQHPLRSHLSGRAALDFNKYIKLLAAIDASDRKTDGRFTLSRVREFIQGKEETDVNWQEHHSRNLLSFSLFLPGMYQQWCHAATEEAPPPDSKPKSRTEEPKRVDPVSPPPKPEIWWKENRYLIGAAVFCLCVGLLVGLWISTSPRFAGKLLDELPLDPLFVNDPMFSSAWGRLRDSLPKLSDIPERPSGFVHPPGHPADNWKVTRATRPPKGKDRSPARFVSIQPPPRERHAEIREIMGPELEWSGSITDGSHTPDRPEFSLTIHHVRSRRDYLNQRRMLTRQVTRLGTMTDRAAQRTQIAMNQKYGDPWDLLELPVQTGVYRTTSFQREMLTLYSGLEFPVGDCNPQSLEKIRTALWERYLAEGSKEERRNILTLLVEFFIKPTEPAVLT